MSDSAAHVGLLRGPDPNPGNRRSALGLGLNLMRIAVGFCLIAPLLASGQSHVEEYRLKAAFLFHFAQFVEWPPSVLPDPGSPLVFCVLGIDPFQGDLEETVQGKSVAGRAVRIRYLHETAEIPGCHLLFLDRKHGSELHELLTTLSGAPILSVGESPDFLRHGGMIRFCMEDRKVRFEVSQKAAEKAHLKISSRLLLLARSVID